MNTFKNLLTNKSLLILGFAELVSGLGNWITSMAVFSLLLFQREGTVAESSGIFLAAHLPALLLSPVAGWLLDRYNRKNLIIISQVLAGLAVSGLIFTQNLTLIYILIALEGAFITLVTPARQVIVATLVEGDELTKANAFLQQLASFLKIGAPIFAGFLLTLMKPQTAIILDVISFGLAAVILCQLPSLPPYRKTVKAAGAPADQAETEQVGFLTVARFIKNSPMLALLFVMTFACIFIIIGYDVTSAIFTRDILKADEDFFGLLIGLIGTGTLAASLFLLLYRGSVKLWPSLLMGQLLFAVIPGSLVIATHVNNLTYARTLAIIGCLIGGVGNGLLTIQSSTLLQILSPSPLLGRLSGLYQSTAVLGQLTGLLLTSLIVPGVISMSTYFLLSACLLIGLTVFGMLVKKTDSEPSSVVGQFN